MTREQYIERIRGIVVLRLNAEKQRRLLDAKLTYGAGGRAARGTCFFRAWDSGSPQDFVEIAARGEQSNVQLAGTTIHELAHVSAGPDAGHGAAWKLAARELGLIHVKAAGQEYSVEHFDTDVWEQINSLPLPSDGRPIFSDSESPRSVGLPVSKVQPCPLGIGTRNGTSRGPGSGSRLIKAVCPHCNYCVWTSGKWLNQGAPLCPKGFPMEFAFLLSVPTDDINRGDSHGNQ